MCTQNCLMHIFKLTFLEKSASYINAIFCLFSHFNDGPSTGPSQSLFVTDTYVVNIDNIPVYYLSIYSNHVNPSGLELSSPGPCFIAHPKTVLDISTRYFSFHMAASRVNILSAYSKHVNFLFECD